MIVKPLTDASGRLVLTPSTVAIRSEPLTAIEAEPPLRVISVGGARAPPAPVVLPEIVSVPLADAIGVSEGADSVVGEVVAVLVPSDAADVPDVVAPVSESVVVVPPALGSGPVVAVVVVTDSGGGGGAEIVGAAGSVEVLVDVEVVVVDAVTGVDVSFSATGRGGGVTVSVLGAGSEALLILVAASMRIWRACGEAVGRAGAGSVAALAGGAVSGGAAVAVAGAAGWPSSHVRIAGSSAVEVAAGSEPADAVVPVAALAVPVSGVAAPW